MTLPLPDKWIRKAVSDQINNIVVDTFTIPCFDSRVTGNVIPSHYVLMTTQTNSEDKRSKCGSRWQSSILLDIVTRYIATGNTGSRLLADNIANAVLALVNNLQLDVASGLNVIDQTIDFPPDISTVTENENVFRKLIRIELYIN